jgi:hypothetical protein
MLEHDTVKRMLLARLAEYNLLEISDDLGSIGL